jgi:secondary thiamine-phosphate synthase enzyme
MHEVVAFATTQREQLVDITDQVAAAVSKSGVTAGLCNVYARGATAAIMIQENWDDSVQTDVITLLRQLAPQGVWLHDRQDGNADAHLKSGIVGASEAIPIVEGTLGLSTWQNVFFCEFDGPRRRREAVLTILAD